MPTLTSKDFAELLSFDESEVKTAYAKFDRGGGI